MRTGAALLVTASLTASPLQGAEVRFEPSAIAEWPVRTFQDRTTYELAATDTRAAVRAEAAASASALYREIHVDLAETACIQWSWRIDTLPQGDASERSRAGDDYAARIYLVREGFLGKLSAKALNYVHARGESEGATWDNAYTSRARMMAVGSGNRHRGQWTSHRRNMRADWKRAFGENIDHIDGVAIMTDADDTGSRAAASYGTIRFLPCDGD